MNSGRTLAPRARPDPGLSAPTSAEFVRAIRLVTGTPETSRVLGKMWWPGLRVDDEFAADLCFLAVDERQDVVGVAQCWTGAFIEDLVVHPSARRRGIATALLRRVFWEFRRRGAKHVDLKVQMDNPTGAVRLYEGLGMREVALDGS